MMNGRKALAFICCLSMLWTGCATTVPLRGSRAVPVHPHALYPVKVAVLPFIDDRPDGEKNSPKRISWPGLRGQVDYFGKEVPRGLALHIADYLRASQVFRDAEMMEFMQTDSVLKSLGFRAALSGRLAAFDGSYDVPKWVLVVAVLPIPLFGLTLAPILIWPKQMKFKVQLFNLELKDLETNRVMWSGAVEVEDVQKKMSFHIGPKWYLGETAERAAKQLVQKLAGAKLEF